MDDRIDLLIYIPCWSDYRLAIDQAIRLREQMARDSEKFNTIKKIGIVISVNGVAKSELDENLFAGVVDEIVHYEVGIGGDVNISNGYLKSLQYPSKYFWNLSTNDIVNDRSLEYLDSVLSANSPIYVVSKKHQLEESLTITSTFERRLSGVEFGLISGVIYSVDALSRHFPQAPKMGWTGWGQLAIIESAAISAGSLSVMVIPKYKLFNLQNSNRLEKTREQIRVDYRHSFFGMPILLNILYYNNRRLRKKYIKQWLIGAWFQIRFYNNVPKNYTYPPGAVDPGWIQELSHRVVAKNGMTLRIMYLVGSKIDFDKIRNIKLARQVRRTLKG